MTIRIPSMMAAEKQESQQDLPASDEKSDSQNAPLTTPFAHETVGLEADASMLRGKHSGAMVLGLVLCIAGATLFGMRTLGNAGKIALLDIKIDYPLDGVANTSLKDQQLVLQDLRSSTELKQVPLEDVQMNPFEWRGLGPAETQKASAGVDPAELSRRAREQRARDIDQAFGRLVLNSIIGGRIPVARISGELVKVGAKVGDYFTVSSIDGRRVVLVADDKQYVMSLGQ